VFGVSGDGEDFLYAATERVALNVHNDIDCLNHQRLDGFRGERIATYVHHKSTDANGGRVSVNGSSPASVSGGPRVDEIQRFGTANFADNDDVWAHSERDPEQLLHRHVLGRAIAR
jgi:hypothetical protein